ncbi:putative SNAP protein (soluble N-ethylmaleimide-sensitive factor Attachment Protein) [Besnoitia besnoiti]|uniref:Putative SNAP protein (Soluble N-ethylmaleimide-sensitive factor Attachment Protein) n=1 Tax=Besnoitia besnoiti TaxID=94643 RepID=A0A2A9MJX9_BESBE|nr:putative SNAP protein (soluble N-ethylmaleimide-sensitive factor Attachment Protein) [Besnoitia besnoiti]PFH37494.1 putative SNAP protein (soluble N-ethylmaleimide-sensitive factor Attachment Protein) [Besnoitia besnoiti]
MHRSASAAAGDSLADIPELLKKADGLLRPAGFFISLLGRGSDPDAALSIYTQCAQRYKLARRWTEAADCYVRASFAAQRAEDFSAEAQMLAEAGNVLKRVNAADAEEQLSAGAAVYVRQGRWGQAAKLYRGIAEMYEEAAEGSAGAELGSAAAGAGALQKILFFYKKAAETYELDEYGKSAFSQCRCKYAEYAAKNDETIHEAIQIFEQEGDKATRNNLLQFSAKDFYLKALILLLSSGDAVSAKIALDRYMARDPRLEGSREGRLAAALVSAMEEGDVEPFTEALDEYDRISKLDAWKIHFLLKAKRRLMHADGGGGSYAVGDDGEVDLS